ncbi:hypothetical protein [Desemzia sp. FAM 23989]|uniref:hypothetical protein n=1 Tax=Desemzia sp. FAM 23989 TaxID=3259523 RepID=UPI0038866216
MKKILLLVSFLVLFLSGCGGRDLSNVRTSLYGHWIENESGIHYYFSDEGYIKVTEDGREEYNYKVLDHDEVKNMIRLDESDKADGSGFTKDYIFSNDERTSVEVTAYAESFKLSNIEADEGNEWVNEIVEDSMNEIIASQEGKTFVSYMEYVDSSQEP